MEAVSDQDWICEAADIEKLYEMTHQRGTLLLAYQLSLSSIEPLNEEQVRAALTFLPRKCPNLRLCFGYRDGALWFRRSFTEVIDFQVVDGKTEEEVSDELQTYRYDTVKGPLWCARLMVDSKHDVYNLDQEDFPYASKLFFGMHHSIADGITNLKVCKCFVSLLNDIISGNTIHEESQIGHFVSDVETDKLVASKITDIQGNSKLLQHLKATMSERGLGMPALLTAYPIPKGGQDKTHNITHILHETTTKKFIIKCKAEEVTLHSAFTALTLATTLNLLLDKGRIQDSFRLIHGHVINLRRYWEGDTSKILGCHAHAPINLCAEVPKNVLDNFWDFARHLHKDIHNNLKEETVFLRDAYLKLNSEGEASFDDIFKPKKSTQVDVGFSNLGDVTSILGEGGPYVKPFLLVRQVSLHYADVMNFAHLFHTFRGRLIVNLLYNTKYFTKELAQEYCNKLFSLLEDVL